MTSGGFQALHKIADLLGAATVGDEERVGSIDDNQILDPEEGDELAIRVDINAGGVMNQRIAAQGIAVRVAPVELINGVPASDVVPADVAGGENHDALVRGSGLENGIVDRNVFAEGKDFT